MNTFSDFRSEMEDMLNCRILPFWLELIDNEHGGFYGYVGPDGHVDPLAPKGVILHSRILWTFSEAYRRTKNLEYREAADHAYLFLVNQAMDKEYGGLYWMLDGEGKPLELFKHSYNQAFGVYALSNYYLATGKKEALDLAMGLFSLIEKKWRDDKGYLEQLTRTFGPMNNEELSENGVIAERTMNTLLHIMEAYTVLYEASRNTDVRSALIYAVRQLTGEMYNPAKERLEVFFDANFKSLIDLHSYGHDIEASWLIDRALSVIGDESLTTSVLPITKALYDHVMRRAYTSRGVYYECHDGHDNTQRDWWVQAEAIIGIANDYQKYGGDKEHLEKLYELLDYLNTEVIGPFGEWAWTTYEDGTHDMVRELAGPWKCPYHNARMCMEIMTRFAGMGEEIILTSRGQHE